VARDRFDFEVARGCDEDDVTSRRALDLKLTLATVAAPGGTLQAVDPAQWLQHAGIQGVRAAPQATVHTLDERGQPRSGVEVHALVESGDAVPLGADFEISSDRADTGRVFSDASGSAAVPLLVGVGSARVLLHARGLAGSPIAFDVTGLASPDFTDESVRVDAEPVAAFAGNYDYDAFAAPDLFLAFHDVSGTYGTYWRGGRDAVGFQPARRISLVDRMAQVVGGSFDLDAKSDIAIAANGPATLWTMHHDDTLGDSLMNRCDETLPAEVHAIGQVLVLRASADGQDDLALKVETSNGTEVLIYLSKQMEPNSDTPSLYLAQRFALPGFVSNPDLAHADVDGDGDDELLLLNPLLGVWIVPCGDARGLGSGSYFVPAQPTPSSWTHLFANAGNSFLAAVDVDEDGLRDLVVLNDGSLLGAPASLQVALGNGTLQDLELDDPRPVALTQISVAAFVDLNGDGHVDVLAVTNNPPQRALLMGGDGHGQFAAPLVLDVGMGTLALAVADVNVDGMADIGFLGSTSDGTYLLMKLSR
jgi:hypothetical protein